jgi:hypothetical protein
MVSCLSTNTSNLIISQPFEEEPLDPAISFEDVEENRVKMITGRGKMVYWKGSNVSVIEKDKEGQEQTRRLVGKPDGQGILPAGAELYITQGKVKEG